MVIFQDQQKLIYNIFQKKMKKNYQLNHTHNQLQQSLVDYWTMDFTFLPNYSKQIGNSKQKKSDIFAKIRMQQFNKEKNRDNGSITTRENAQRCLSPKLQNFLRHTTYDIKTSSMWTPLKSNNEPFESCQSATLPNRTIKKKWLESGQTTKKCSYSPEHKISDSKMNQLKGEKELMKKKQTIDFDSIVSKVQKTASLIEKLKKFQLSKSENIKQDSQIEKKTNMTFDRSFDSPSRKHYESPKKVNDWDSNLYGFKKRNYENNLYTPKPELISSSITFENVEKLKRGFTPNIKKILSPTSNRKFNQKLTIEDFVLENSLGGGKFGVVHRAYHHKTRSIYALKKISKKVIQDYFLSEQLVQEIKIQSFMEHQNIAKLYGFFEDKEHIYMVLEFMPHGNLLHYLRKKGKVSEKECASITKQIFKGLKYMHGNGIAHRDLKPENIVISNGVYKICDFGWATVCNNRRKTYCGTFDYTAPEIFQGKEYDLSVDIWSLGIIVYELLVGKQPFYHMSRKISISNVLNVQSKKLTFPSHISCSAQSFIQGVLRKNPAERLTLEEIENHQFLSQVIDNDF